MNDDDLCLNILYVASADSIYTHVHCVLPKGHGGSHMVGIPIRDAPGDVHLFEWDDDESVSKEENARE